jgi:hypothetical protein
MIDFQKFNGAQSATNPHVQRRNGRTRVILTVNLDPRARIAAFRNDVGCYQPGTA